MKIILFLLLFTILNIQMEQAEIIKINAMTESEKQAHFALIEAEKQAAYEHDIAQFKRESELIMTPLAEINTKQYPELLLAYIKHTKWVKVLTSLIFMFVLVATSRKYLLQEHEFGKNNS